MKKEEYINDKLFDMGERLKRNYAQPSTFSAPAEETSAPSKAPVSAASGRSDEFSRTLRDLEGRIANDLSAVDAELTELETRRKELERFNPKRILLRKNHFGSPWGWELSSECETEGLFWG